MYGDSALPPPNPFPFWLFSASSVEYLAGLLRFDTLEELPRRIGYLLGREEQARPDGYWDYDAEYHGTGFIPGSEGPTLFQVRNEAIGGNSTGRYPAASALQTLAAKLRPNWPWFSCIHPHMPASFHPRGPLGPRMMPPARQQSRPPHEAMWARCRGLAGQAA